MKKRRFKATETIAKSNANNPPPVPSIEEVLSRRSQVMSDLEAYYSDHDFETEIAVTRKLQWMISAGGVAVGIILIVISFLVKMGVFFAIGGVLALVFAIVFFIIKNKSRPKAGDGPKEALTSFFSFIINRDFEQAYYMVAPPARSYSGAYIPNHCLVQGNRYWCLDDYSDFKNYWWVLSVCDDRNHKSLTIGNIDIVEEGDDCAVVTLDIGINFASEESARLRGSVTGKLLVDAGKFSKVETLTKVMYRYNDVWFVGEGEYQGMADYEIQA